MGEHAQYQKTRLWWKCRSCGNRALIPVEGGRPKDCRDACPAPDWEAMEYQQAWVAGEEDWHLYEARPHRSRFLLPIGFFAEHDEGDEVDMFDGRRWRIVEMTPQGRHVSVIMETTEEIDGRKG